MPAADQGLTVTDHTDAQVRSAVSDLVLSNKMLTAESVLDAYGHVSIRHPTRADRFLMSADAPPVLATAEGIQEYALDGEPVPGQPGRSYLERYIHAAVYAAHPEIHAVCHNHAPDVLPFCVSTGAPLLIISHTACALESPPAVWDIGRDFGPGTDLMITDLVRARSMVESLGAGTAVLMRSHGATVVGRDLRQLVVRSTELVRNARALTEAVRLGGEVMPVADESARLAAASAAGGDYGRQWRYFEWRVSQLRP